MTKVVSVYGYGRFGKLWADILSEDFQVKVYSRRGLKEEEVSTEIQIASSLDDLFDCDAMFFCVAISSFEQVLKDLRNHFKSNTVYFDTCSVKMYPAQWMENYIPDDCQIIATHPMFGPDSYYNSDFKLPIVMSNIRAAEPTFNFWFDYFSKLMRVEIMSPAEHDKMVAYSQGITHYVGRVLADLDLKSTRINTMGYSKLLEIIEQTCNDTWQLFTDLQRYNPYTKIMREDLHKSSEKIYGFLNYIENGVGKERQMSLEEWHEKNNSGTKKKI